MTTAAVNVTKLAHHFCWLCSKLGVIGKDQVQQNVTAIIKRIKGGRGSHLLIMQWCDRIFLCSKCCTNNVRGTSDSLALKFTPVRCPSNQLRIQHRWRHLSPTHMAKVERTRTAYSKTSIYFARISFKLSTMLPLSIHYMFRYHVDLRVFQGH